MSAWETGLLILEDEPLIALDMEATLEAFGVSPIVCLSSCAEADAWLRQHTPGAAVLDVMLKDGSCSRAAETLSRRNVPFIVCSGSHEADAGKELGDVVWLPKPTDASSLVLYVGRMLGSSRPIVNAVEPTALRTWKAGFL